MLSYDQFMSVYSIPMPFTEFNSLICAIANGLLQLMKSHLSYVQINTMRTVLTLDGIELTDRKYNNKQIHQAFQRRNETVPKFFLVVQA